MKKHIHLFLKIVTLVTVLITVHCLLFTFHCFAQQAQLDSLLRLNADHRNEDNTKLSVLNSLAEVYQWMQVDSGLIYTDRAIAMAQRLNNQQELANAYINKVRLLHYQGKVAEREKLLEKVLPITTKLNDKNNVAEYYLQLARVRFGDERIALSRKALDLYSQTNNMLGIGRASFFLGRHVGSFSNFDSVQYVVKARDIFQKLGNQP